MSVWPIVATHALVGWCAWLNGWVTGRYLERRVRTEIESWPPRPPSVIDLAAERPYDWTIDGDAHGPPVGCPDCHWRGWVTIPDWALDPFVVDLVVDCPNCTGALR